MKTTQSLAALLAIGSLGGPVFATPLGGKGLSILNKRGAADIAVSVLSFISSLIPPEHNSWVCYTLSDYSSYIELELLGVKC